MSNTVATTNSTPDPIGLVERYQNAFTSSLPSHINHDQWVSVVMGVLRSNPPVMEAARNDPGRFLAALLQAARRGLEPGTEQFHLVPFSPKKGQPRIINGIVGYEGLVELIYRAGAVASVIVECVYDKDTFVFRPGTDERPQHTVDWFAGDRGQLIGVYAYAIMKDGATSKVIVMGKSDVARAIASSAAAHSEYGPWKKHPAAMWMKTAVRQLAKWVPTSSEYRRQQLRDAQQVLDERERRNAVVEFPAPPLADNERIDELTGEVVIDTDDTDQVETQPQPEPEPEPQPEPQPEPEQVQMATKTTKTAIARELVRCGIEASTVASYLPMFGVPDGNLDNLTQSEAVALLDRCRNLTREQLTDLMATQAADQ